jgi:tRNA threonylcarbamoyladenosine biosynthesis protein TsaE
MKEVVHSLEEMKTFAEKFVYGLKPKLDSATVVGLYGDLGTGKTTFTKALADAFGIEENITSPTFVIMKSYGLNSDLSFKLPTSIFNHLIHIDAYRLEKSSELTNLGWDDLVSDSKNLIVIEWPERVADIMPEHIKIKFNHISENEREVEVFPM